MHKEHLNAILSILFDCSLINNESLKNYSKFVVSYLRILKIFVGEGGGNPHNRICVANENSWL